MDFWKGWSFKRYLCPKVFVYLFYQYYWEKIQMEFINTEYSQTPLAKKLGIKEGYSILVINKPPHYYKLFSDLPKNLNILKGGTEEELDFTSFIRRNNPFILLTSTFGLIGFVM